MTKSYIFVTYLSPNTTSVIRNSDGCFYYDWVMNCYVSMCLPERVECVTEAAARTVCVLHKVSAAGLSTTLHAPLHTIVSFAS